jgi:hypothetical protein
MREGSCCTDAAKAPACYLLLKSTPLAEMNASFVPEGLLAPARHPLRSPG